MNDELLQLIRKDFGTEIAFRVNEPGRVANVTMLPTGIASLDNALGGGVAQGRIIEIYGEESSGKSAMACAIVGSLQRQGYSGLYVDVEYALNLMEAEKNGVDLDDLVVSQPETAEVAMKLIETVVRRSPKKMVIVLDSVASLLTKRELEGDPGDANIGLTARLMSQMMRKLAGATSTGDHVLIFINQMRMKIGVLFGDPRTTTGGNSLKFYASQRISMGKRQKLGPKEDPIGQLCKFRVEKNKVAPPFKTGSFTIWYNEVGIDYVADTLDNAALLGVVRKVGGRFYYPTDSEQFLGGVNGREKVIEYLREQPLLYSDIYHDTVVAMSPPEIEETTAEPPSD